MSDDARATLDLLAEHEAAMGDLYVAYAAAFPESRDLWRSLAGEEYRHASRLESLRDQRALSDWLTPEVGRRSQAFRSSIDYVKEQTSRAEQRALSQLQAFAVAKDIEDALIDRLEVLPDAPSCAEIGGVLAELRAETSGHREMLARALENEKGAGR